MERNNWIEYTRKSLFHTFSFPGGCFQPFFIGALCKHNLYLDGNATKKQPGRNKILNSLDCATLLKKIHVNVTDGCTSGNHLTHST